MQVFLAGIALVVGIILLARWFASARPSDLARALKVAGLIVGVLVLIGLAVAGRLASAIMLGAMLAPLILRWKLQANRTKSARGPSPGQKSTVSTGMIDAWLDHDTGGMDGRVRRGVHEGRLLSELTQDDLLELLEMARADDPQAAALLEAYLDRVHGQEWRDGEAPGQAGADGRAGTAGERGRRTGSATNQPMTEQEALAILGLEPDATAHQIKTAHRNLMKRFHPDHGGSSYLAAKLNEAKDLLLRLR